MRWLLILALFAGNLNAAELDNAFISLPLHGFFTGQTRGGQPKRLNVYLVRRDGQWIAGLGTATVDGRAVWNTALMLVDPTGLTVRDGKISGTMTVTLVPDPWRPRDGKVRTATVALDLTTVPSTNANEIAAVTGTWEATVAGNPEELAAAELRPRVGGEVRGGIGGVSVPDLTEASYDLALYDFMTGQATDRFQRRRALSLGVKNGRVVSARFGQMDLRHNAYDYEPLEVPTEFSITPDGLTGTVTFAATDLDGEERKFRVSLAGRRVANWVAGTWTDAAGRQGFFRGNVGKTAVVPVLARDDRPWVVPLAGHVPVRPGEHPRLFFRQADLPALRRRAATPAGQQIVKRLRELLNGSDGETMPVHYNPATNAYSNVKFKAVPGSYSISHAAGYGFLYQLTGERKYAELARQCVEKGWAGQRDFDDRYAWVAPGGELRAGPSVGWTAVAYDLCYEAWPEAFRREVALQIQNYADGAGGEWNQPEGITLRKMVLTPKHGPKSNHYGAVLGGCGLAVLAILDDPGTDRELLAKYRAAIERNIVRHLSAGWGDGGYFAEGWGASRVGTQGGFLCLLQAMKVALGRDYLNVERPNASFITMVPRCLMVLGPPGYFPYRSNMGPTYGNAEIGSAGERNGFSKGGYFSEGFGAIADRYKPALLWTAQNIFGDDPFDMMSLYPHRPMLALINWPTFAGITARNPAEVMPRVTRDRLYEYFVFRNRFQDKSDIVATVLLRPPDGTRPRDLMVWGCGGLRLQLGEPPRSGNVTEFVAGADGSGLLATENYALAVDYSKASGADALIVTVAPKIKPPAESPSVKASYLTVGPTSFNVVTLAAGGQHPDVQVRGDAIVAGQQTIRYVNGRLTLDVFTPATAR